jgi:hypothetical protein
MGHANKGSSSQNNYWWQEGEDPISISGVSATVNIPDSYGFVLVTHGTPAGLFAISVSTFDAEWFYGRVLEITTDLASDGLIRYLSTGNLRVNAGTQDVPAGATIRFRAVRTSTGEKVWLQVGFQQYSPVA